MIHRRALVLFLSLQNIAYLPAYANMPACAHGKEITVVYEEADDSAIVPAQYRAADGTLTVTATPNKRAAHIHISNEMLPILLSLAEANLSCQVAFKVDDVIFSQQQVATAFPYVIIHKPTQIVTLIVDTDNTVELNALRLLEAHTGTLKVLIK